MSKNSSHYKLIFPSDFEDYAWDVESKGWFSGAKLVHRSKTYELIFFEPVRLSQEIESELVDHPVCWEKNLLIIKSTTQKYMEEAVKYLVENDLLGDLKPND